LQGVETTWLWITGLSLVAACSVPTRNDAGPPADAVPLYPGMLRSGFHAPGLSATDGEPRIEATDDGVLIGGSYIQAGAVRAPAKWNGADWIALPATDPYRVAVAPDGTMFAVERQVVCDLCGDVEVKRLSQGQWETLPGSFPSVTDMVATTNGLFLVTTNSVHRFDGTGWTKLGSAELNDGLEAIVEHAGAVSLATPRVPGRKQVMASRGMFTHSRSSPILA
jgi:hypothetical protein